MKSLPNELKMQNKKFLPPGDNAENRQDDLDRDSCSRGGM